VKLQPKLLLVGLPLGLVVLCCVIPAASSQTNRPTDPNSSDTTATTITPDRGVGGLAVLSGNNVCGTLQGSNPGGLSLGSVTAGHAYSYQASGCIVYIESSDADTADPDGYQYQGTCTTLVGTQWVAGAGFVCPGLYAWSLIGKISGSTCVQLGSAGTFTAPSSGSLTLFFNDNDYIDDSGSWTVCLATYTNLVSSGPIGGPFSPSSQLYTLTNTSSALLSWAATNSQPWLSLSAASGTLAAGAATSLTATINTNANTLIGGSYSDTILFTNLTTAIGTTTRNASLTVIGVASLSVSPTNGLISSGGAGGPFSPVSQVYSLTNNGTGPLNWSATNAHSWCSLSATSGTLAVGAGTNVTVSINSSANALALGTYVDTVVFTNVTNGVGTTNRPVTLTVGTGMLAVLSGINVCGTVPSTTSGGQSFGSVTAGQTYGYQASGCVVYIGGTGAVTADPDGYQYLNSCTTLGGTQQVATSSFACPGLHSWSLVGKISGSTCVQLGTTGTFTAPSSGSLVLCFNDNVYDDNRGSWDVCLNAPTSLVSTGIAGGPFSPSSQVYMLTNTGSAFLSWAATNSQPWLSLSAAGGTLAVGAATTVTATINTNANALIGGSYSDTILFTNLTTAIGTTTRNVSLTVIGVASLSVSPTNGLISSGGLGGPFIPASQVYSLTNNGTAPLNWSAANGQSWCSLSPASGSLAVGASASVTVSINSSANALALGTYTDTVLFTNVTNGVGTTTRPVSLTIQPLCTITTSSSPAAGGTSTGAGTYPRGNTVTVIATANNCYGFNNWSVGGVVVSTSATYAFTVLTNVDLVANFSALGPYTITTSNSPAAGGTTSGAGTYNCGSNVTVWATPGSCYHFVNWTDQNSNVVSTSTCYSFTPTVSETLVANFAANGSLGAATVTNLWSFTRGVDGANPALANLIQATDTCFYGTAGYGGANGHGTVFRITPAGALTGLWSFANGTDGAYPFAPLLQASDGNFYGTTAGSGSGSSAYGTVFRITPQGTLTTLWPFTDGSDGATPYGGLMQGADGNLYGTTSAGGADGHGSVYRITTSGTLTTLWPFTGGSDGATPYGGLVQGADGNLYGTTTAGGTSGDGTVYRITPSGTLTNLWSFTGGADGANPNAGLAWGTDGNLYGTTAAGGANGDGTVFRITPTGTLSNLCAFQGCLDGADPYAPLVQGSDGNFYGTTYGSGSGPSAHGTVFRITPSGTLTILASFTNGADGANPYAGLVQGVDGSFYGTTLGSGSGPSGNGNVFRLSVTLVPPANQINKVAVQSGNLILTIPSVAGETYQLQYTGSLTLSNWANIAGASLTNSIGGPLCLTNFGGASQSQRFYRFAITP